MSFDTVRKYFREISAIPRGSGNTEKISAYCERFAEERGLDYIRDKAGNVIIKKEGHLLLMMIVTLNKMLCGM